MADEDDAMPLWYADYPEEDHGILSKYETEAAAIKSIGARERYARAAIVLPKADVKPEDRAKQVREIMVKLGAFESADGYRQLMDGLIPAELKDELGDEELQAAAKEAAEHGLLPDVFTKAFKNQMASLLAQRQEKLDAEAGRLRKKDDADKELTARWGTDKTKNLQAAEAWASHLDATQFALENSPQGGMSQEERMEKGGRLVQLLREINHPLLWRAFAEQHRRVFGENPLRTPANPQGEGSTWKAHYDRFKEQCGVLGDEEARAYADRMTGGPRP